MKEKRPYDYYLILATALILFLISTICIYAMFYFKLAMIHQMPQEMKAAYMNRMNAWLSPFVVGLVVLLGICVPKRLLPTIWLNRFAVILTLIALLVSLLLGVDAGLKFILVASLGLQLPVLILALGGHKGLWFEKTGYWVRIGSSLVHLGLILFILDLFFHKIRALHLPLFWTTVSATSTGMICCFYSGTLIRILAKFGLLSEKALTGDKQKQA